MGRTLKGALFVLLLSTSAQAAERFGVLELFVRGAGAYCRDAAPHVIALQAQTAGRAVVLEYPYDSFTTGRIERFWKAYTGPSPYLPLAMVGSGFDLAQGPVDYGSRYRQMLEAELARPARASLTAWSRRWGGGLQAFVTIRNTGEATLGTDRQPTVWLVVWEDGRIGLTDTYVRATVSQPLTAPLPAGGSVGVTLQSLPFSPLDQEKVRAVVLLDELPPGASRYDLLQSVLVEPAGVSVTPSAITLTPSEPEAEVTLDGPHVLAWTATADVPWLEVSPTAGSLPGTAVIRLADAATAGETGTVRFAASGSGMELSSVVTVTAPAAPGRWSAVVPAAAHAPGAFGSLWRTDLAAVNDGALPADLTLTFAPVQGGSVVRTAQLPPRGTREWADVLASLFDVASDASASGAIHLDSDRPLCVASRTFSEGEGGTFGGYLPAVEEGERLGPGAFGVLPQLTRTALFRTNVGLTNPGETVAAVTVRLFGPDAEPLGEPVRRDVPAGGLLQVDDVFGAAGAGDREIAWATVETTTDGARVWAYASVIDNRTGDPTIVPLAISGDDGAAAGSSRLAATADDPPARIEQTVPAVAHAPGAFGSLWRTDVAVVNPSGEEAALEIRFVPAGGGEPVSRSERIGPGTRLWADVLVSLFGLDPAAVLSGALHLSSDVSLVVSSRTFNVAEKGSYGAHLAGVARRLALAPGRPGVLPLLERGAYVRTNVGVTNPGTDPVTVAIRLTGADGGPLGTEAVWTVPPGGLLQPNDVFDQCGAGDAPIAWARIEVRTEGGAAFAYASVIDNRTGDPTIVPALVPASAP